MLATQSSIITTRSDTTHLRHFDIAKLAPQIIDGVQSNKSGTEESNPFDTADTPNAQTSQTEPDVPFQGEALALQAMEPSPAHGRGECEAKQHRVEQNESGDGRVRILAQHHQTNQPDCGPAEVQLSSGVVRQRDTDDTESGIESSHKGIVHIFRVLLAGLEFERSIVACQVAGQANQHLSEWGVYIEVELALEVVGAEFTEVGLIPGDDVGSADLVQAGEESESRQDNGENDRFPAGENMEK